MNDYIKCTKCGQDLKDLIIETSLHIRTFRKRSDDSFENIQNANLTSVEYLCPECFNKFKDTIGKFNV